MAYGEDIVPPISIAELPTDIKDKSSEELANLMAHIAGWSYQVLLDVPRQGLKAQQKSLEQIIVLRKWLQARQHSLFQLLAFRLIVGIDKAILNEIFRQEMAKHGITVSFPTFKAGTFDEPLLKHLLLLNEVNEQEVIKYAISLEGKIPTYCRQQNYPIEDYVNSIVLKKFSEEMDDYTDDLKYAPAPFLAKFSKPLVADLLFVQTLGLIDKKRDIQMLTSIYFDNGFPNNGKDLKNRIKLKLSLNQRIRVSTGYKTTSNEVMDTLLASTEREPSLSYGFGMTMFFLPFLNELDIIQVQYLGKLSRKFKRCTGQWLTFSEDMELDEDKMTLEDKERARYCSIEQ